MAIGYTGSDGNMQAFSYTPVDPTEDMMRQAFERSQQTPAPPQPQGPTPYWENPATYYPRQEQPDPVAQAKAATAAAYKYIAFRGYQQDLKEGKSAADAFAKWGPMLVQDVSLAPAMKAFQPQPKPVWMPANPATGQPGSWVTGDKVEVPKVGIQSTWVEANLKTGEPAHWSNAGTVEQVRTSTRGNEITPTAALNIISDPYKWQFAQSALGDASTNLVNIAKTGLPSPKSAPNAPVTVETAASAPASQGMPTITSKAEFDKLPSGTVYLNKGKPYRKP